MGFMTTLAVTVMTTDVSCPVPVGTGALVGERQYMPGEGEIPSPQAGRSGPALALPVPHLQPVRELLGPGGAGGGELLDGDRGDEVAEQRSLG